MSEAEIIQKLLENRGLKSKKDIAEFFRPRHPKNITSPFNSVPAIKLITSHIAQNSKIAVYGDYDVDGICSTAILWETLYSQYQNVFPHIPHRREEGYGLSKAGIDLCLNQGAKLIICVDNGIVAHEQVKYCRDKNCDIIIIDHHEKLDKLPNANCIIHGPSTCAAGLTWFFCRDFLKGFPSPASPERGRREARRGARGEVLELVALAVVCDIVPLLGINRSFVKFGLEELSRTTRPGLLALFAQAGLDIQHSTLNTYHAGFVIGPRLNAMGRLEHAIDSLRLLCTQDSAKAVSLAKILDDTNRLRQQKTEESLLHAFGQLTNTRLTNLVVVAHESYDEGVIGLIAAKLVEKFSRPAIAVTIGEVQSKGSARSVPGFHITDHLRSVSHLLSTVGGHAMAAGFTLDNINLARFLDRVSHSDFPPELLKKTRRIDCEIPISAVHPNLYSRLQSFEPFGLGNPTPAFLTLGVQIENARRIGKNLNHLKFKVGDFDAVWFNAPEIDYDTADIVYSLDNNTWNGETKLQLMIKDIQPAGAKDEEKSAVKPH